MNSAGTSAFRQPTFWGHMIRFFMYNFVGALMPLFISYVMRKISATVAQPGAYAPELLFFAVMISATALGDLSDETKIVGISPLFQLVRGALLFGALSVAAIYGMYQYNLIVGPANAVVAANITMYSILCAAVLFLTSLLAELVIAKIRT